jgi:hypothetical protein
MSWRSDSKFAVMGVYMTSIVKKALERAGPGMVFSSGMVLKLWIRSTRVVGMVVVVLTAHRLVAIICDEQ